MAYSLAGFVFNKDNNLAPGVLVQGLFVKKLPSSSPTTFSVQTVTDVAGYYSLNLSDASWLNVTGSFTNGDEVLLMFWLPPGEGRDSYQLTQFASYIHVIDSAGTTNSHFKRVRLMENLPPICGFTMPATAVIDSPISITNTTTDSPHGTDLTCGGISGHPIENVRMNQHYRYGNQTIFEVCQRARTDWDWQWERNGVSTPGIDVESNNVNNLTHTWSNIGDYLVHLKAWDLTEPLAGTCDTTGAIRLKYPSPILDFTWSPYPVGIDTPVTFVELVEDPYNRLGTNTDFTGLRYRWYIRVEGVWTHMTDFDNIDLLHSFLENGTHYIRLEVYWNDGFDNKISFIDKPLVISNTPPMSDFDFSAETKCSIEYLFTSTSSDLEGEIIYQDWSIYRISDSSLMCNAGGADLTVFKYAITEIGVYRAVLTVTDQDGANDTKTLDFEIKEIDCGCEGGGSQQEILRTMWTPGAAAGASWRKMKPRLVAELVSESDRKWTPKIEAEMVNNTDKDIRGPQWKSISTERKL